MSNNTNGLLRWIHNRGDSRCCVEMPQNRRDRRMALKLAKKQAKRLKKTGR